MTLQNLLISAFEDTFLTHLSTHDILKQLYNRYGKISPSKLAKVDVATKKRFDMVLPIRHLNEQLKNVVYIAGTMNMLYTAARVLSIAYNLIQQIWAYKDTCKEWRNKLNTKKKLPKFKCHLMRVDDEMKEKNRACQIGYTIANMVQEDNANESKDTIEYLASMAIHCTTTVATLE